MTILWKLLRKHISIAQLTGFSIANLLGMFIILLSIQFYEDVSPIFSSKDQILGKDYFVVSKRFSTTSSLFGKNKSQFSQEEIDEIRKQTFTESLAPFVASQYKVGCYISMEGIPSIGTDMFFESVPDEYVDVDASKWKWDDSKEEVPIVLPKSYLAIYNFGFAPTRSLPKLDENLISKIGLTLVLRGNGMTERMKGRVVGFTDKLNTILVPMSFMKWSNDRFASSANIPTNRLIVSVNNPADESIASFMVEHDYEIESDKLKNSKSTYFLRIAAGTILIIGIAITLLSLYVLILSIYLVIEKSTHIFQNLLLLGYSRGQVAFPYQMLVVVVISLILIIAYILMFLVRDEYMELLWKVFPSVMPASLNMSACVAISIFIATSMLNSIIIYKKIKRY